MTRQIVALGRKRAEFATVEVTYSPATPGWRPKTVKFQKPDHDLIRKQRIEDALSEGVRT